MNPHGIAPASTDSLLNIRIQGQGVSDNDGAGQIGLKVQTGTATIASPHDTQFFHGVQLIAGHIADWSVVRKPPHHGSFLGGNN